MARVIQQTVTFAAPPRVLYDLYTDARKHSAATGGRAAVTRRAGGRFSAFGGALRGKILGLVPNRMVVQTWRGADWRATDLDSILLLTFTKTSRGARVTLVHANVPDRHQGRIRRGWRTYYWTPWRAYLSRRSR
jgi:activator of HSP90 ATPase